MVPFDLSGEGREREGGMVFDRAGRKASRLAEAVLTPARQSKPLASDGLSPGRVLQPVPYLLPPIPVADLHPQRLLHRPPDFAEQEEVQRPSQNRPLVLPDTLQVEAGWERRRRLTRSLDAEGARHHHVDGVFRMDRTGQTNCSDPQHRP